MKTSVIRALTFILEKILEEDKMKEFFEIFEDFIKNTLISNNNQYSKQNFLKFVIQLCSKQNLDKKYLIESFLMGLEFLDLEEENFSEVKINSFNFLKEFFNYF